MSIYREYEDVIFLNIIPVCRLCGSFIDVVFDDSFACFVCDTCWMKNELEEYYGHVIS